MTATSTGILVEALDDTEANRIRFISILKDMNAEYPIPLTDKIRLSDYVDRIFKRGIVLECRIYNRTAGFVTFYANNTDTLEAAFSLLGVLPEYRGRGVAQLLFDTSFQIMKQKGMKRVFSFTHRDNRIATSFHQRMGFSIDTHRVTSQHENIALVRDLESSAE